MAFGSTSATPPKAKWSAREAQQAVSELVSALKEAGVVLPSVELEYSVFQTETPLISLGRARPDVVKALAEIIRKGAE